MSSEISESAKAVQEVAKATGVGLEATRELGGFVSRIVREPLDAVVGILTDRLQFMRFERQRRLLSRWSDIVKDRKIEGALRIVSPKLAFPIIEHASLEEDDGLQDLWANLLASAVDPNFEGTIRSAYIDIIKQLEPVDVQILNLIYQFYVTVADPSSTAYSVHPRDCPFPISSIPEKLRVGSSDYETAIDNLIRVRCVVSFVESKNVGSMIGGNIFKPYEEVSFDHGYDLVCMTSFGVDFVEACISPRIKPVGNPADA